MSLPADCDTPAQRPTISAKARRPSQPSRAGAREASLIARVVPKRPLRPALPTLVNPRTRFLIRPPLPTQPPAEPLGGGFVGALDVVRVGGE
jgi:hypothetical protein